ncbi:MAG: GAF domain-containing protein, partial [Armatimonadota bacterium]
MASAISAADLVAAVRRNSDAIVQTWARLLGSARARIAADFAGGAPEAWMASVVALLERPGQATAAHRALVERAAAAGLSGAEIAHAYASLGEAIATVMLRDGAVPTDERAELVALALRIFEQAQKWLYEEYADQAGRGRQGAIDCREIVDLSTDVIIALDAEKRITLANPALTALTGLSAAEVLGRSIEAIVNEESAARLDALWAETARPDSHPMLCELSLRTKGSDELVPIDASCIALPDEGSVGGVLIIGRDVRKRKQAEMQLQRQNRFLAAINAIAEAVGGSLELEATLHAALTETVSRLRADFATIHLLSPSGNELRLVAHAGISDELAERLARIPADQGIIHEAVRGDRVIIAQNDPAAPPVFGTASGHEPVGTTALSPLVARGQTLGVIALGYRQPQRFDDSDRQLLSVIGRQIGTATDNARLYDSARQAAMCDSLTGLYDHGELWRRLEAETERCRR